MEYRKFGNTIVARIDRGEEILAAIREIAGAENIQLASVTQTGCHLWQTYTDDLWLSISAPFIKKQ